MSETASHSPGSAGPSSEQRVGGGATARPEERLDVLQRTQDVRKRKRRWASALAPLLVTLCTASVAAYLSYLAWQAFMETPWTRDGTVRAYVVTITPEVTGRVVELPVIDNQFVHKGDLLMKIDPRDYEVAVADAQAQVEEAQADFENKTAQAERREKLSDFAVTLEERGIYASSAKVAGATVNQRKAELRQAQINLGRVEIRSPVDGWITNLQTQVGDYAVKGTKSLSVVDSSFWVDGYFEETMVGPIKEGDPARVKLLGYPSALTGHVESLARGINVANAQPDQLGLANVNPIFTWVRLAQRIPVRVRLDNVPPGVRLAIGMTATVQVFPGNSK